MSQLQTSRKCTREEFFGRLQGYLDGVLDIVKKDAAQYTYHTAPHTIRFSYGPRYTRVYITEYVERPRERIYSFLDMTNGDILKPATYKAPAKHARGNIFDADYGLSRTTPYGPEYLR